MRLGMRLPDMFTSHRTSHRTSLLAVASLALLAPVGLVTTTAPASASDGRAGSSARTVLDVRDLDQGAPPALAWTERRRGRTVVHGPDGTRTPVPNRITELAPMGSGYVIQVARTRGTRTRWVGADGSPGRRTWRTGDGLAVSARGKAVAFSGKRGRVWTVDQEADRVLRLPRVPISGTGRAVALTGEDCRESATSNGCSVYVNAGRGWVTTSHGLVDRAPRVRLVSTGRGRWLGGITSISDTGTCSVMMRNQRVRWRTCENRFSDIAPGGRHVAGLPAYGDGFGPTTLDVLATRDGSVAHSFTAARNGRSATYFDEVWEDRAHLLVVTFQAGEWAIVRLGVDGSMEYAVAPRAGSSDLRSPFQLQTR